MSNNGNDRCGEVFHVQRLDLLAAVADFFMDRVRPFVEAEGEPAGKPQRRGEPIAFYARPDSP